MAILADCESWCRNLGCTTCGCHVFRHGLHELARGAHPDSEQWTLHFRQGEFPESFDAAPAALSVTEQAVVSAIVSQLDIRDLKRRCRLPNWLGYLGIVLQQTMEAEAETKLLTHTLLPQLLAAIDDPVAHRSLKDWFGEGRLLRWQDLEEFERFL